MTHANENTSKAGTTSLASLGFKQSHLNIITPEPSVKPLLVQNVLICH